MGSKKYINLIRTIKKTRSKLKNKALKHDIIKNGIETTSNHSRYEILNYQLGAVAIKTKNSSKNMLNCIINKKLKNNAHLRPQTTRIKWLKGDVAETLQLKQTNQSKKTNKILKKTNIKKYATYLDNTDASLLLAAMNTIKNTNHSLTANDIHNIFDNLNTVENNPNKPIECIHAITDATEPNYYTNEQGLRIGKRIRRSPKRYDQQSDFDPRENKSEGSDESKSSQNSQSSQNEEKQNNNENKINTNPNMYQIDKNLVETIKRIQNPEYTAILNNCDKFKEEQHDDILCYTITYCIKNPKFTSIRLSKYYPLLLKLVQDHQFFINSQGLLCIKQNKEFEKPRLVVPQKLIKIVIFNAHKGIHANHPGIIPTQQKIEKRYWWYLYKTDIRNYVTQCYECQTIKGSLHHKIGKLNTLHATKHNDLVHLDFCGPINKTLNILLFVDNYTGVSMLIPTTSQRAETIITALIQNWMPIHGMPRQILTDRGTCFTDELNRQLYDVLGIYKLFTSAYHPQTNSKVERMVQELKKQIRALNATLRGELIDNTTIATRNKANNKIKELLPSIQFAMNQRIRQFCDISPHEMLYGSNLNEINNISQAIQKLNNTEIKKGKRYLTKLELVNKLRRHLKYLHGQYNTKHRKYVKIMIKNFDKDKKPHKFEINDLVMYYIGDRKKTAQKLRARFTGPYKITHKINHNTVKLENKDKTIQFGCHVSKLKPYIKEYFIPLTQFEHQEYEKYLIKQRDRRHRSLTYNEQPSNEIMPIPPENPINHDHSQNNETTTNDTIHQTTIPKNDNNNNNSPDGNETNISNEHQINIIRTINDNHRS